MKYFIWKVVFVIHYWHDQVYTLQRVREDTVGKFAQPVASLNNSVYHELD